MYLPLRARFLTLFFVAFKLLGVEKMSARSMSYSSCNLEQNIPMAVITFPCVKYSEAIVTKKRECSFKSQRITRYEYTTI